MEIMILKRDELKLGILLGFLAPIVGLFGYYFFKFSRFTLAEFFEVLILQKSLLTAIVSLCLICNAVVFTLYINAQKDKTAKGVFIATCLYALASLAVKWFL
jgi:hypothetical protein